MNDSDEAGSSLRNRLQAQAMAPEIRQFQDAGNVDRRWWETEEPNKVPAKQPGSQRDGFGRPCAGGSTPPPPPPPLNPESLRAAAQQHPGAGSPEPANVAGSNAKPDFHSQTGGEGPFAADAQASFDALIVQRLEMELAAARDEATALHEMLEDLPEIFERKFHQRLQSILEQQQHLLADNQALREQIYTLAPGAPGVETRPSRLLLPASQPNLPQRQKRRPLGETLRKMLGLVREAAPESIDPDRFS
jgi:hypothetical protein